jgi:hypothetical protein
MIYGIDHPLFKSFLSAGPEEAKEQSAGHRDDDVREERSPAFAKDAIRFLELKTELVRLELERQRLLEKHPRLQHADRAFDSLLAEIPESVKGRVKFVMVGHPCVFNGYYAQSGNCNGLIKGYYYKNEHNAFAFVDAETGAVVASRRAVKLCTWQGCDSIKQADEVWRSCTTCQTEYCCDEHAALDWKEGNHKDACKWFKTNTQFYAACSACASDWKRMGFRECEACALRRSRAQ